MTGRKMKLISIMLTLFIVIGVVLDIFYRRIPNWLILLMMLTGIGLCFYNTGIDGVVFSLLGLGTGIGMFVVLFLLYPPSMNGIGGADVKFCGVIGTFLGWRLTLNAVLISMVIGGIVSLILAIVNRRKTKSLKNIKNDLVSMILTLRLGEMTVDKKQKGFPYLIPVAIGTGLVILFGPII